MKINEKSKIITVPVNIIATIIAVMILLRFGYVFYDFIQNPFHPPATLGEEAVKHVMTALILLELLALTLRFLVQEVIDPNLIIIKVMTALGRDLIVMNFNEVDYLKTLAIGIVFGITIFGLYILKKRSN
jgi:uncharacterized membrane protein (DUF373 family)